MSCSSVAWQPNSFAGGSAMFASAGMDGKVRTLRSQRLQVLSSPTRCCRSFCGTWIAAGSECGLLNRVSLLEAVVVVSLLHLAGLGHDECPTLRQRRLCCAEWNECVKGFAGCCSELSACCRHQPAHGARRPMAPHRRLSFALPHRRAAQRLPVGRRCGQRVHGGVGDAAFGSFLRRCVARRRWRVRGSRRPGVSSAPVRHRLQGRHMLVAG